MKDKMHSFPRFVSDAKGPHAAMSELFLQKKLQVEQEQHCEPGVQC
jgi:hypothetical protein